MKPDARKFTPDELMEYYNKRLDHEAQADRWVHEKDPERIKRDITAALGPVTDRGVPMRRK